MTFIRDDDPPAFVLIVAIVFIVLGLLVLWFAPPLGAQGDERYTVALGKMEESSTCTFSMKPSETAVVTHPKAESCRRLRMLVGRAIRLTVQPEPEP